MSREDWRGQQSVGSTHEEAHEIFLQLKNKRKVERTEYGSEDKNRNETPTFFSCLSDFVQIVADWLIDFGIAIFHFSQGRYFVGTLTLFFVFVGGIFVNYCLLVLTRRKGDQVYRQELKKIHPILLYLIYIPSFLPIFSGGTKLYFANKLRKLDPTLNKSEVERLEKLINICDDLYVTDLLYESSFEAHPQAILQMITLVERPFYKSIFDFLPLIGVASAWIGITMTPIKLTKSLNNVQISWMQVVAGLGNKAVTLMSFTFIIAASRQYYADPGQVTGSLATATLLSITGFSLFSELPGLVSFHLELKFKKQKNVRIKKDWEFLINLISILIPLTAITYWMLVMFYADQLDKIRVSILCPLFIFCFIVNVLGFLTFKNKLQWLGHVSTDILLLLSLSLYSHFRRLQFQQIDFNYEPNNKLNEDKSSVVSLPILTPTLTHTDHNRNGKGEEEERNNNDK